MSTTVKQAALSIGLNYGSCHRQMRLNGCQNDSNNVVNYLKNERGYDAAYIRQSLDKSRYDYATSRVGIIESINKLAVNSWRHNMEEIFIHYSGHGTQVDDYDNNEEDGKDEALVPWDFAQNGMILDDKLNDLLQEVNPSTRVICVFDCCHSGTLCDLPFRYDVVKNDGSVVESSVFGGKSTPAKVIALSGCKDAQVSMDAYNVGGRGQYSGAMSSCLLQVLRSSSGKKWTVKELLPALHMELNRRGFAQKPVITSSVKIHDEYLF
jgi:hypothetical protein